MILVKALRQGYYDEHRCKVGAPPFMMRDDVVLPNEKASGKPRRSDDGKLMPCRWVEVVGPLPASDPDGRWAELHKQLGGLPSDDGAPKTTVYPTPQSVNQNKPQLAHIPNKGVLAQPRRAPAPAPAPVHVPAPVAESAEPPTGDARPL